MFEPTPEARREAKKLVDQYDGDVDKALRHAITMHSRANQTLRWHWKGVMDTLDETLAMWKTS
jgi:hypothetical protein